MLSQFETPRLVARPWQETDFDDYVAIYNDAEVGRFIGGVLGDVDANRGRLRDMIRRNSHLREGLGSWAVVERRIGRVIGNVLLKPAPPNLVDVEIGWHLARSAWGHGFAVEIAAAVLGHAFDRAGLDEVIAVVDPANVRSSAVATRIGMDHRGETRAYYDRALELFVSKRR